MLKRVLSLVLCLCMLMSNVPTWSIAMAEDLPIIEEIVISEEFDEPEAEPEPEPEPEVEAEPEKEPVKEPEKEAKPEEDEAEAEEEAEEKKADEETAEPTPEPTPEPTEPPRFVNGYVRIEEGKTVYADSDLSEELGVFAEDAIAYVSDREKTEDEDQDILTLRFACGGEMMKGYLKAKHARPLSVDQTVEYENEAANGVHYKGSVYLLDAEFDCEDEQTESLENNENPAAEENTPAPEVDDDLVVIEEIVIVDTDDEVSEPAGEESVDPIEPEVKDSEATASEAIVVGGSAASDESAPAVMDEETLAELRAMVEEMATYFPDRIEYVGGVVDRYPAAAFASELPDGADTELDIAYITCSEPYLTIGEKTYFTVEASGGTPPYTYRYLFYHQPFDAEDNVYQPVGNAYVTTADNTFAFTPEEEGRYIIVMTVVDSTGTVGLTFQSSKYETATAEEETDEEKVAGKIKLIVADLISDSMSDYRKALVLHDWLTGNADYDESYTEHDPEGVLILGSGVCESYALAYQMLLTEADVENIYVTGTAGGGAHAWNLVKMGGDWYHVDCTWDDPVGGGSERYNYFGLSDAIISRDHTWNDDEMRLPECTATKYNYVLNNSDVVFGDISELDEKIAGVSTNKTTITLYYTGTEDISSELQSWIVDAFNNGKFGSNAAGGSYTPGSFVTTIKVTRTTDTIAVQPQKILLQVGETEMLKVTTSPENTEVVWSVEDETIATVSEIGLVTGVSEGETTLTCAFKNNANISMTCTVEVTAKASQGETTPSEPEEECLHESTKVHTTITWHEIATYDENGHTGSADWTTLTYCEDCGASRGSETKNMPSLTMEHEYENTICKVCGYNSCEHETLKNAQIISEFVDATLSETDETKHIATYQSYEIGTCSLCGVEVRRTYGNPYTEEEPHTYVDGYCDACDAQSPCDHADAEATVYYELVMKNGAPVQIEANDDGLTHTGLYNEYTEYVCECGEEIAPELTNANVTKTFDHEFEDGVCYECGYVEEEPAAWDTAPELVSVVQNHDAEGSVTISWKAGSELTEGYSIHDYFDGKYYRRARDYADGFDYDAETGLYSCTLTGVAVGTHGYYVRALKNENSAWVSGNITETVDLSVQNLWALAPELVDVVEDEKGNVIISWKAGSKFTKAFSIHDTFDGTTSRKARATADKFDYDEETGVYSYMIEDELVGDHVYYVRAYKYANSTWTSGGMSAKQSITVKAEWKTAPEMVSVVQNDDAEGSVTISWKAGSELTEGFSIHDYYDGKYYRRARDYAENFDYNEGVYSCTLTGAGVGTHGYYVRALKTEDGAWVSGDTTETVNLSVKNLWAAAPELVDIVEDEKGNVVISWKAGSEFTKAFSIHNTFDGTTSRKARAMADEFDYDEETGVYSYVIKDEPVGDHVYYVRAYKYENSTWTSGGMSEKQSVTVKAEWKTAPKLVSVVQNEDAEGSVTISWTAGSELTEGYSIHDYYDGKYYRRAREYADGFDYNEETGVYSCTLTDVAEGEHGYYVRALKSEDGAWVSGNVTETKTLNVSELWAIAPEMVSVVQNDDAEGSVTISWKAGSKFTEAYAIHDYFGGKYYRRARDYAENFDYDEETGVYSCTLTGVAAGTHGYYVRAVNYEGGAWVSGNVTETVNLSVKNLWAAAPELISAVQTNLGEVTLRWKAGSALTEGFSVHDYFGGKYYRRAMDAADTFDYEEETGIYTLVLKDMEIGEHEYYLISRKYVNSAWTSGTKSNTMSVTVSDVTWQTAPTLSAENNALGEVKLSWTHPLPSEVEQYAVYEKVDGTYVEVYRGSDMELTLAGTKESGEYTYAVRTVNGAEAGNAEYGWMSADVTIHVYGTYEGMVSNFQVTFDNDETSLTWDAVPFAVAYKVYAIKGGMTEGAVTEFVEQTNAQVTNDYKGIVSYYVVPAFDKNGVVTEDKAYASLRVPVEYGDPVNLDSAVFSYETKSVELAWTASEMNDVERYEIYRDGVLIGSVEEAVGYVDTEIELGKEYAYTIVVVREQGVDGPGEAMNVQIPVLGAPVIEKMNYNDTKNTFTWSAVEGAESYEIWRSDDSAEAEFIAEVTENSYEDVVTDVSAAYGYVVCAKTTINGVEYKAASDMQILQHSDAAQLVDVVYDGELKSLVLSWTKPEKIYGGDVFEAYVITNADTGEEIARIVNMDTLTYTYAGTEEAPVKLGNTYNFGISTVYDVDGVNIAVGADKAVALAELGQVQNLRASYFDRNVTMSWSLVEYADGFEISRSTNDGAYEVIATVGKQLTYEDRVPERGATYSYQVKAVINYTDSTTAYGAASEPTVVEIGEMPTLLSAKYVLKEGGVVLTWEPSDATHVKSYSIFRRDAASEELSYSMVGSVDANVTTYVDTDVEEGKTYEYAITVVRVSADGTYLGEDGPSDIISAEVKGLGPVTVLNAAYEDDTVTLTWDAVTAADFYEIVAVNGTEREFLGDTQETTWSIATDATTFEVVSAAETAAGVVFGNPPAQISIVRGEAPVVNTPALVEGGLGISWNAIESEKLTGYKILRDGVEFAEAAVDVTSVIDATVAAGEVHVYKVIAVYTDGTMSDEVECTVPAYTFITEENGDGTVTVTGVLGSVGSELVIPATIDGKKVTKIGENAFAGNTAIISVTIEGEVVEICDNAFANCTNLTTAVLPNTVEVIGVRAFYNCTSLSSMTCQ